MNDLVSPDALDSLVEGIKAEATDKDAGCQVAYLDEAGGAVDPEEENEFASEEELERWRRTLHEDTVFIVVRYEEETPQP